LTAAARKDTLTHPALTRWAGEGEEETKGCYSAAMTRATQLTSALFAAFLLTLTPSSARATDHIHVGVVSSLGSAPLFRAARKGSRRSSCISNRLSRSRWR